MSLKNIFLLLLVGIIFISGALMNIRSVNGIAISCMMICSLLLIGILGLDNFSKLIEKKGPVKGILLGILVIIVLIPLVFFGTCVLGLGGGAVTSGLFRGLFGK